MNREDFNLWKIHLDKINLRPCVSYEHYWSGVDVALTIRLPQRNLARLELCSDYSDLWSGRRMSV